MEWICDKCDNTTEHKVDYISEEKERPKYYLDVKLTCKVCETIVWAPSDIFDVHACSGDGHVCYCNDTEHQHCTECDSICCVNPKYEP